MVGPLAYLGGKNGIPQKIISLIPEHNCYIEAFCSGAQVFFHKEPSNVEILNDLDEEVFNFLRVCQLHKQELVRYLQFCTASRKWFELFQKQEPSSLSDIQRAARFFYLQKNCYGGLINRQSFSISVQTVPITTRTEFLWYFTWPMNGSCRSSLNPCHIRKSSNATTGLTLSFISTRHISDCLTTSSISKRRIMSSWRVS